VPAGVDHCLWDTCQTVPAHPSKLADKTLELATPRKSFGFCYLNASFWSKKHAPSRPNACACATVIAMTVPIQGPPKMSADSPARPPRCDGVFCSKRVGSLVEPGRPYSERRWLKVREWHLRLCAGGDSVGMLLHAAAVDRSRSTNGDDDLHGQPCGGR